MSLCFLIGAAGSGKTHHILHTMAQEEARDPFGPPLLLVVPQQATFTYERQLAEASANGGFCRSSVSGLSRLAAQAALHAGVALPPAMSEGGRLMLMRAAAQHHAGELQVFAATCRKSGFAAKMAAAAEEMLAYDITPEMLEAEAARLEAENEAPHLAQKLRETALLYQAYLAGGAGDLSGHARQMDLLADCIRQGFLHDTAVWVDGFFDLTPAERRVLAAMGAHCPSLEVALTLDPAKIKGRLAEDDIFAAARRGYDLLKREAEQAGAKILPPRLFDGAQGRFAESPLFSHVEQVFSGKTAAPYQGDDAPSHLHILSLPDKRSELLAVGRRIRRLVREEGLRYRQIALLTRDSAPYEALLPEVFGQLDIPYFLDSKKPLRCHPLFDLVSALLEIWAYHADYAAVIRLVKNPLVPLERPERDLLDNYCLAHGVRFYHWTGKDWNFPLRDREEEATLVAANEAQKKISPHLAAFLQAVGKGSDARTLNRALLTLLSAFGAEEALSALAERAEADGRGEDASGHRQAWDKLLAFLTEAETLLGTEVFSPDQLSELYETAFTGLTVSSIPPGLDQVFVSSLERSRTPALAAAFLLGANEGTLPRRVTVDGLFGDGERRLLRAHGLELAPDTRTRQFAENYLVYLALTRCSGRLTVSYLAADGDGRALAPSPVVRKLLRLFPGLTAEDGTAVDSTLLCGGIADLEQAVRHGGKQSTDPLWRQVWHYYANDPACRHQVQTASAGAALGWQTAPLSADTLSRLYGKTLHSSVSRLERYRRCPFSYFSACGLKLNRRAEFTLTPADRGDLFHTILSEVGEEIDTHGPAWQELDEVTAKKLIKAAMKRHLPRFLSGLMASSRRYDYIARRTEKALLAAVMACACHCRRGQFRPAGYELDFGMGGTLPAYLITLPDGRTLSLRGRIDRIDMAEGEDACYFRVVDYKTGSNEVKEEQLEAGLQLQLLVYLLVVLQAGSRFSEKAPLPAGFYYAHLQDGMEKADGPGPLRELPANVRLSGLTLADPIPVRLADRDISGKSDILPVGYHPDKDAFLAVPKALSPEEFRRLACRLEEVLRESAAAMLCGMVQADPLCDGDNNACSQCDFAAVCGFDRIFSPGRRMKDLLPPQDAAEDDAETEDAEPSLDPQQP